MVGGMAADWAAQPQSLLPCHSADLLAVDIERDLAGLAEAAGVGNSMRTWCSPAGNARAAST
jgi:hypothetical protein